jgi:hypothetical protein
LFRDLARRAAATATHVRQEHADRPTAAWPFWLGLAGIVFSLLPYLDQALAHWREDEAVKKSVLAFFRAVAEGRKEAALRFLSDEYRSAVESRRDTTFDAQWQPTGDDVIYQVLSIRRDAAEADVRIAIVKSTFSLKPTVHLRRRHDASWAITGIDGVAVDPRWIRYQAHERTDAGVELSEELSSALRDDEESTAREGRSAGESTSANPKR